MEQGRDRLFERLTTNLEEMTTMYRQLLEIVRREREFLIEAKLAELDGSNAEKENLLMKIRLADTLRQKLAEEYAVALGADAQQPRLLELAAKTGGPGGERLRTLHAMLETLIKRLTEINRGNEEYAKSALKTLNGAMSDIKETLSGKKTYERKGTYKLGPETTGNFVRKEG